MNRNNKATCQEYICLGPGGVAFQYLGAELQDEPGLPLPVLCQQGASISARLFEINWDFLFPETWSNAAAGHRALP